MIQAGGMEFAVSCLEVAHIQVDINRRGLQLGMTEHGLDMA